VILLAYARAIYMNWFYVSLPRAVCLVVVAAWIIPTCVMASERYLSQAIPIGVTGVFSGWRAFVRRMMRGLGAWPVKALGPSSATLLGGGLIWMSLALVVDGGIFGSEHTGYQVLTNTDNTSWGVYSSPIWAMAQDLKLPALAVADRVLYGLSLLVALFAVAGVAARRFGKALPGTRILAAFVCNGRALRTDWDGDNLVRRLYRQVGGPPMVRMLGHPNRSLDCKYEERS